MSFKEDVVVIEAIDKLAKIRGSDRSAIIREALRNEIRRINRQRRPKNEEA